MPVSEKQKALKKLHQTIQSAVDLTELSEHWLLSAVDDINEGRKEGPYSSLSSLRDRKEKVSRLIIDAIPFNTHFGRDVLNHFKMALYHLTLGKNNISYLVNMASKANDDFTMGNVRSFCGRLREGAEKIELLKKLKKIDSSPESTGLPRCYQLAYQAHEYAISSNPDLGTDREVYDWLMECDQELHDLPRNFETFQRYLSAARAKYDTRKHNPKHGRRVSGSIVNAEDI